MEIDLLIHRLVKEYEASELKQKLNNIKKELDPEEFNNFLHFTRKFTTEDSHKFKYTVDPILFYKYCTIEKIEVLIDFGLDINIKNFFGKNALFYVDAKKSDFLLKKGIEKLDVPNNERRNALFHCGLEKLKVLLSHGYDINIKNVKEESIMFHAPDIDVVDFLITQGFSVNELNKSENNMIMGMALNEHLIKDLIDRGLNINHLNKKKQNALFYASVKKIEFLLDSGINIHHRAKYETNCAFHSPYNCDKSLALKRLKLLKEAGVDLNINDRLGKNIFRYLSSPDEVEFLILEGVRPPDYNPAYLLSSDIKMFETIKEVQRKIAIDKEREKLFNIIEDIPVNNDVRIRKRM